MDLGAVACAQACIAVVWCQPRRMGSVEAKLLEQYQNVMAQNETRTIALERQVAVRVSIPTVEPMCTRDLD